MPSPIDDPLWDLLLSTNDCFPGCGCDDDYFQMTPERIDAWIDMHGIVLLQKASNMLSELRTSGSLDVEALGCQLNHCWSNLSEPIELLFEWQTNIDDAINIRSS